MTIKPSPRVYLSGELHDFLNNPSCSDEIKEWIDAMGDVLKSNMFAGDSIRKRQIPDYYINRFGVNNLYRYQHPEGFRSCYTLFNFENVGVCPVILDIMSHAEYDRRFGYETT